MREIVNGHDTVPLRPFTVSIRYKTADYIIPWSYITMTVMGRKWPVNILSPTIYNWACFTGVSVKLGENGQIWSVYDTDTIRAYFCAR